MLLLSCNILIYTCIFALRNSKTTFTEQNSKVDVGVSSTFSGSLLKRYDGQHTLDMTETDEGEDCSGIVNGKILFSVTKMGTQSNNKQRYSQGHHSTPCCTCVHGGNIVGITVVLHVSTILL